MKLETERKFLVSGNFMAEDLRARRMVQGWLCNTPRRCVRVRLSEGEGWLTVKGFSADGISRPEGETLISADDARDLLALCEPGLIDKTRYYVPYEGRIFEVDVFHGENEGLVVAEVELSEPEEKFERPRWLGKEVTGDERYYNAFLCRQPFGAWKASEKALISPAFPDKGR